MNEQKLARLKEIQSICKRDFSQFAFWPAYFERRFIEFISFERLFPVEHFGKVLEVGCGNGFYSCLLSQFADEVIATDLETPGLEQHSGGLKNAREMIGKMGFKNISLQAASIEAIPFPDNSFDMVFSSHVLIYLGDKTRAMAEVRRVLKPGGFYICIVPTRASKVYNLLMFQVYILKRAFYHLVLKHFEQRDPSTPTANPQEAARTETRGYVGLKDFPYPPSFGGLKHWKDEYREWSPDGWKDLLVGTGKMKLISQTTTQLNPLMPLLGESFHYTSSWMHGLTWKIESRLGKYRFFQRFGINSVLVVQK